MASSKKEDDDPFSYENLSKNDDFKCDTLVGFAKLRYLKELAKSTGKDSISDSELGDKAKADLKNLEKDIRENYDKFK